MGLRFILGRSGSGKTTQCIKEIIDKQSADNEQRLIFIVPEQFSLQAEKDLIEYSKSKGIMAAQVLSFGRLAFSVFSEKGGANKPVLDEVSKAMALRKVIGDCSDSLEYYKKSIDKQGFLEQLSLTVSEFFQYGIEEDTLEKLMGEIKDDDVYTAKLKDIKLIFEKYCEFISEKYISTDETLDILANVIDNSAIVTNSEVWIDGFYGFTPQEYNVILKLFENAKQVNITLTIDESSFKSDTQKSHNCFYETWVTAKKLNALAADNKIEIAKPVFLNEVHRFKNNDLKVLEKQYFSYSPKGSDNDVNIRIVAASDRYDELNFVAKEIISLTEKYGYRYRDIAVVSRDLEGYGIIGANIFEEYDIPLFIDAKKDILSNPFVELIRSLIEIFVHDFKYKDIFRYLKTGLVNISRDEADLLENYVLAYGINGYKWFFDNWEVGFGKDDEDKKIQINSLKNKVTEPLQNFRTAFPKKGQHKINNIIKGLFEIIEKIGAVERLNQISEELSSTNQEYKKSEYIQSFNKTISAFKSIDEILGDESVSIDEFGKIIDAGLSNTTLGLIPPGVDQVIFGDIERSRLPKVKIIFVIGTNDGILPSPSEAQGIFSQSERNFMTNNGIELANSGARKAFEEQYLIYSGITKAEDKLIFSYSIGDQSGKTMRPSSIISKIIRIFPSLEIETTDMENLKTEIYSPTVVAHKLGTVLRNIAEEQEIDDVWKDIISFYKENEYWNNFVENLYDGLGETNSEPKLEESITKRIYGEQIYSSVSRLERYQNCPYSYFLQYNLKAKERPVYKINTPDLGIVFHNVLEGFSNQLEIRGLKWEDVDINQAYAMVDSLVETLAENLGNKILLSSSTNSYIVKRIKRVSKRAVWALIEHIKAGRFRPVAYELGFGIGEKLPPIVIELSDGTKMVMNGKIDRVDMFDIDGNKYVKIIDYKSGSKSFSLEEVFYGLQLQLLIYLSELCKMGGELFGGDILPAGVFYFRINDPFIKSASELSDEEIEQLLLKELKLSGLVLQNDEVIKALDTNMSSVSNIIPLGYNKDGSIKKEASIATMEEYLGLMKYSQDKAKEIGEEISKGNIDISPYKSKQFESCQYCDFKPICGFDTAFEGNGFRKLKSFDKQKIMSKMINNEIENENRGE